PPPVLTAWDGNKLVGDASPVQGLVQANAVLVRNCCVFFTMNNDGRRQSLANIRERREATSKLRSVGLAPKPHYSKSLAVRTFQQINHIGDSAIINNGGDLGGPNYRRLVRRTIIIAARVLIEHPGRHSNVAPGRLASYN